jgi:hypothetical protein
MEGDVHVLPGWVGALALAAATFRNYRSVNPGSTMTSVGQTPAWNRPARRVTNCARCSRLRRYANEMSSRSACRSERRPVREVLRTGSSLGLQPTRLACLLHRPPFPRLHTKTNDLFLPERCSVCRRALGTKTTMQTWISLRVARMLSHSWSMHVQRSVLMLSQSPLLATSITRTREVWL